MFVSSGNSLILSKFASIYSGVPSKNLPQPPINKVSPENSIESTKNLYILCFYFILKCFLHLIFSLPPLLVLSNITYDLSYDKVLRYILSSLCLLIQQFHYRLIAYQQPRKYSYNCYLNMLPVDST